MTQQTTTYETATATDTSAADVLREVRKTLNAILYQINHADEAKINGKHVITMPSFTKYAIATWCNDTLALIADNHQHEHQPPGPITIAQHKGPRS